MNIAIILAGGIGKRFGANRPKQFVEVFGKPIVAYTIDIFQRHPEIDAIEVVCHKEWKDYLGKVIKKHHLTKVKWMTDGGSTFQESVINGINYLNKKIKENDIVVIHFGASPFLQPYIISDCIKVCKKRGNAISTTDFYLLSGYKKTCKSVTNPNNYSDRYINRDSIACMNSPHAFKYGVIKNIYEEAIKKKVMENIEPHTTALMYKLGKKIYFSKGSQINIKITNKEDLILFKSYVANTQFICH